MAPKPIAPAVIYRPEDYRPEDSAAYLMRRIVASHGAQIDAALEPQGLTNAQWVPLLKLHFGQASTVAELARECQLDTGAMTRTLDRLEGKGLVTRVRSSQDRRVVNLQLTAEGRAAAQALPGLLCDVQNAHLRGLSREEWQQLMGLLRRIHDNALALQEPRQAPAQP